MLEGKMIGTQKANVILKGLKNDLKKRKVVNERAIALVLKWVDDNFKTQGGKVGGWKKLTTATNIAKTNKGYSPSPLLRTGDLRKKWRTQISDKTGRLISAIDNPPYGLFHDEGAGHLPQRRIIPKSSEVLPLLSKVYNNFIKAKVKKAQRKI